jgi:ATP phosphoribosyltransferase regulatory subunit
VALTAAAPPRGGFHSGRYNAVFTPVLFMSSAWLLPEHIADVLPAEARRIEELRRSLLDRARGYGFELVMPPLLEHLDSLLTGTGRELDLRTFKLVDQLSGRTLGCGRHHAAGRAHRRAPAQPRGRDPPVLLRPGAAHPAAGLRPRASRCSSAPRSSATPAWRPTSRCRSWRWTACARAGVERLVIDLADARIVRGVLAGVPMESAQLQDVVQALVAKDAARWPLTRSLPAEAREALREPCWLYGGERCWRKRASACRSARWSAAALDDLPGWPGTCSAPTRRAHRLRPVRHERLCLLQRPRFAIYGAGSSDALARGGRYDEVGAVFGRNRPAVGFSLDLKALAEHAPRGAARGAVRAPWGEDAGLRAAVRRAARRRRDRRLRAAGP